MTSRPAGSRRHLASSPFQPRPQEEVEVFEVDQRVLHDSYGLGRVESVEASAVTVNFGSRTVRVVSPYAKMTAL